MDGKDSNRSSAEKPIRKPDYPLPAIFCPNRRKARAYFYRERNDEFSSPHYGFDIPKNTGEREKPGSVS